MKFYTVIGWTDPNPTIIADSAQEAAEKYNRYSNLGFVPMPKIPGNPPPGDTACYGDPRYIPEQWSEDLDVFQRQIDDQTCYFVEPLCFGEKRCIECKNSPMTFVIPEDHDYLAKIFFSPIGLDE